MIRISGNQFELDNSLPFPVTDKTKHNPSHPKTGYDVTFGEESNGATASIGSHESGSQGSSGIPDPTRRAPDTDRQSAISIDPQPPLVHVVEPYDILRHSDSDLPPSPLSKDVFEPTGPYVEEATSSGCDNREKREVEDEDGSEEVLTSSPSLPTYIPAETTSHMYPEEEVDAANAVQTLLYRLKPDFLTLNMRDLKYLEGRDYIVLRVDVQGGYSVIEDITTRKRAVLKASQSEDYPRLCTLLSKLNHNNVTRFLGAVKDEATVKVFLEYTSYGTVREQFRDNECFQRDPALFSHILEQVFQAVSYLHQEGIRHGDITWDNVVVCSPEWLCKLTNFDQAISVKDVSKERTNKGPSYYSSPELIADPKWSYPSDVWSAMLLLVVMMTGEAPWHSPIERDDWNYPELVDESLYRQRLKAEFRSTPEYDRQLDIFDQLAALARKVFVRDPTRRPSADDLLNSPVMIRASTYIVKT